MACQALFLELGQEFTKIVLEIGHIRLACKCHCIVFFKRLSLFLQQKLALNGDDIPVTNKRPVLGEESRETSEERTYNGADRAVSEESSVTQNGDCVPEEKREREKPVVKENDLKNESLHQDKVKIKEEITENGEVKDNEKTCIDLESKVKVEVKDELDIKEENCNLFEDENGQTRQPKENSILGLQCPWEAATFKKEEEGVQVKKEEDAEEPKSSEDKTKDKSPSPPKELPPLYDSSPYLPDIDMFELVVTSVEQLRALIQKFGDLPDGAGSGSNSSTGNGTAGEEEKSSTKKAKVSVWVKD